MIHILRALPVALAIVRWDVFGKDGPLAALLTWVWMTNVVRWLYLPHIGDDPVRWIIIDLLWVSWYVAHVVALHRGLVVKVLAVLTAVVVSASSWNYVVAERWMQADSLRDILLMTLGCVWATAGLLAWLRQENGMGRLLGASSAILSVIQTLNIYPANLGVCCPYLYMGVASVGLTWGFLPDQSKQTNKG